MKIELEITQEMYDVIRYSMLKNEEPCSLEQEVLDLVESCDWYYMAKYDLKKMRKCKNGPACKDTYSHHHFEELELEPPIKPQVEQTPIEHPGYQELTIFLPNDFYIWLQSEANVTQIGNTGGMNISCIEDDIVQRLINCCKSMNHRNHSTYKTVEEIAAGSTKTFEKYYGTTPIDRETECSEVNCHTGRCKNKITVSEIDGYTVTLFP